MEEPELQEAGVAEEAEDGVNGSAEPSAVLLPDQHDFYKMPAKFGHVPVAEEPLYGVLMDHVDEKFLDGAGTLDSSPLRLLYAGERLHDVRATFMQPGIVSGIVNFPLVKASS